MKNTFGNNISVTLFGESHGPAVGAVLDGLPAGIPVDEAQIAACLSRRKARGDGLSTARIEPDEVRVLSGVYNGRTAGAAIALVLENTNTRSGDYAATATLLRPGHADYTAFAKYHGWQDGRGGGHFSGRLTAALVAAGALCKDVLRRKGVTLATHLYACAGVSDTPFALMGEAGAVASQVAALNSLENPAAFALLDPSVQEPMQAAIRAAAAEGDSVGGILETAVCGLPAGAGEPFFDSVESALAHMLFSIPAVKGVEFGAGFALASWRGSEANDPFRVDAAGRIVTAGNRNGGVNGGITNGMPVVFRTAVKPTPSIFKAQRTVDIAARQNAELSIKGRHDPCIVPRAAIVQSCAAAIALCDLLAARYGTEWLRSEEEECPWNTV